MVEGEGEAVAPELFRRAVAGESLPRRVQGRPLPAEKVPLLRTPSRCGVVEVTRGCGRGCRFCVPGLLRFRSFPLDRILEEIELNRRAGIREVSLQSDDFLRYGSKTLKPERESVLRLLRAVRRVAGDRFGVSFVSAASIMQDPHLLEEAAEILGLGGSRYSTIEMGVETGSPRLLRLHMPGKARPFPVGRWPELVVEAAGLLHDLHWIGCFSLIIGLPGETPDDVMRTMELVDRIKDLNCVITPVVFVPAGGLRRRRRQTYEGMTSEQWALFLQCAEQTLRHATLWVGRTPSPALSWIMRVAVHRLFNFAAGLLRRKLDRLLRQLGWNAHRKSRQTSGVGGKQREEVS